MIKAQQNITYKKAKRLAFSKRWLEGYTQTDITEGKNKHKY